MMRSTTMSDAIPQDAELVGLSVAGDRDAFGRIVSRYQNLVCSLAYSATGSLGQSEDLAQETFITAWKHLRQLREPAKLRSWLCGIARNRINSFLRREGRQPVHSAETIDADHDSQSSDPLPSDETITREEETILWRSLERIPEIYREPLVLFYREQQSVANVADALDLTENAVRQRLSRGRKLLSEQVTAFVEGALTRSTPGRAFTIGVIAALPVLAASASAATVGAVAAKGSAAAKASAALGLSGAILGPILGILGAWFGVKASLDNAQSECERTLVVSFTKKVIVMAVLFCIAIGSAVFFIQSAWAQLGLWTTVGLIAVIVGYVVILITMILCFNRKLLKIRAGEAANGRAYPHAAALHVEPWEFRSRVQLLGLPLIHIKMGATREGKPSVAKGWFALGDIAYGVIACGGISVGVASLGGLSVGLIGIGGVALGLLTFAGFGVGYWAIGGFAVGYLAMGGLAVAWHAALGGAAIAHEFAVGGSAFAAHANDDLAHDVIQAMPFFQFAKAVLSKALLLVWLPMGLVIWQALRARRKTGRPSVGRCVLFLPIATGLACVSVGCGASNTQGSTMEVRSLSNGLRVVALPFADSTNVSIFTYVPMSLTSDGPGQAQWSHLIEHLVIRSTVPAGSPVANAETLPDHMRLDWCGHTGNWRDGLEHHRQWLAGTRFAETRLENEKPRVISECDSTARNFATHKFALAAWAQGVRYGRNHAALKADVTRARSLDVQTFHDRHFAVLTQAVVCVAGGIQPDEVFAEAEARLEPLNCTATPAAPVSLTSDDLPMTWDMDVRHLVFTQPVANEPETIAVLSIYGQMLTMALMKDPALQRQVGMALAGADLVTPEGRFFYVSVSLRPEAKAVEIREKIKRCLSEELGTDRRMVRMLARQLELMFSGVEGLPELHQQIPPGADPSMIEMNLALQLGMNEFRHGSRQAEIAAHLDQVEADELTSTAIGLLRQGEWTVVSLTPGSRRK